MIRKKRIPIICPRHILETVDQAGEKVTGISGERVGLCMSCGHCMAACPTGAVTVKTLEGQLFEQREPLTVTPVDLLQLIRHRRSIRNYRKKPIPRDVMAQAISRPNKIIMQSYKQY